MTLLSIILFLVLIGILCYHKTSLALSTVLLLAYTAVMGVLDIWSYWMLLPVALVLFPFVFTPVRQSLFSARALKMFQKVMPPMSRTERKLSMLEPLGGKATFSAVRLIGINYIITLNLS